MERSITKWKSDPIVLNSLCTLPKYLNFHDIQSNHRWRHTAEATVRLITNIYLSQHDENIVSNLANTFEHIFGQDNGDDHHEKVIQSGWVSEFINSLLNNSIDAFQSKPAHQRKRSSQTKRKEIESPENDTNIVVHLFKVSQLIRKTNILKLEPILVCVFEYNKSILRIV